MTVTGLRPPVSFARARTRFNKHMIRGLDSGGRFGGGGRLDRMCAYDRSGMVRQRLDAKCLVGRGENGKPDDLTI